MLTAELIKKSEKLASLSEEQLSEIVELSRNDETAVIQKTVGEIHGKYDADILEVTGKQRPQGMKTYDFIKATIADVLKEKQNLEEQLGKSGGLDEAAKKKLADKDTELNALRAKLAEKDSELETKIKEMQTKEKQVRVDMHLDGVLQSLKFKDAIPQSIRPALIAKAKEDLRKVADVQDDGTIVFRNEDGSIRTNPSNTLKPYTAVELASEALKDVLENARIIKGTETQPNAGGASGKVVSVDVSTAKTQLEADEIIINKLMQDGLVRGTREFYDRHKQEREAAGVQKLPFK